MDSLFSFLILNPKPKSCPAGNFPPLPSLPEAFGRSGISRGDELFEVNDSSEYGRMSEQLALSRTVRLLFRPGPSGPVGLSGLHSAQNVKHLVKNAFLHIDTTDPEPDQTEDDPQGLSLPDLVPVSGTLQEEEEDALSEASFYSMRSSSSLSSSQCSQQQPSSGRSCPSTDWEFQGYQCHNGQMLLEPLSRSISSGHATWLFIGLCKLRLVMRSRMCKSYVRNSKEDMM